MLRTNRSQPAKSTEHNSQGTKARGKNVRNVRLCLTRSPIKRGGYERGRFLTSELSSGLVTRELIECVPTGTHQVSGLGFVTGAPGHERVSFRTSKRELLLKEQTNDAHTQTSTHNSQGTKAMWQKRVRNVRLCLARSVTHTHKSQGTEAM